MTPHTLTHAIHGCAHDMREITACVICGRWLAPDRDHVDTCRGRCYQALLRHQRVTS